MNPTSHDGAAIDETNYAQYLELYGIGEPDLALVAEVGAKVEGQLDRIIDDFYQWVPALPEAEAFFPDTQSTLRVRQLQRAYWSEFFKAKIDGPYVRSRQRVGAVHATIGLSLQAYFAAMDKMMSLMVEAAAAEGLGGAEHVRAIAKVIHLDTSIVVDTFSDLTNRTIRQQSEAIMAMSTPVTAIWDDILLLPVVGLIDSRRAHDIMKAMLNRIKDTEATVFILDISGVAAMDTAVANHLIKMTKAARLMGCMCIISGVSPAIASTVVELGIDVGTINTRANLKDALSLAFSHTGAPLGGVAGGARGR